MKSKLKIYSLIATCILSLHVSAQLNEWTWMHGDNAGNQNGSYGVQGVSSPTNKPGAMYEGCEWTDHNGNFWLYGGQHTGISFYSDLWKYNPLINEWVWVNGPGGTLGMPAVYGTQGVPSPLNTPGARGWAPSSWVDSNNNLWMWGGCDLNAADMNNLWMYNTTTNEWTWMKGSNFSGSAGSPGVMGVPSIGNEPSARHESTCSWVDGSGDLWTFGGYGSAITDDVWRYSISTNMWTWMKGDPINNSLPIYGIKGVPDPANTPGSRCSYSRWTDRFGNLWLFGGIDNAFGNVNDVWKYNIASNEWTWMKGPNVSNDLGNYGVLCVEDSMNNPPATRENRSCWTDSCGHFWTFGGEGGAGESNDLWKFNPVTNNWTWVSGGTNPNGIYGTIGVSSPTNVPPARTGSFSWQDMNGNLWMGFGVSFSNGNFKNDLWRFVPDPACSGCILIPSALFSAPNHICPGTCTDFVNLSQGATSYIWTFPGATPNISTDANPTNICYNVPGTYAVTLIATNSISSDTLTFNNYVTVYPFPPPQGILQNGDTLFSNAGAVSYQWYHNGVLIPGATDYYYVAPESGNFQVIATDNNGCEVEAVINDVIASSGQLPMGSGQWAIFPNPVNDILEVKNLKQHSDISIRIYSILGTAVTLPTANCQLGTCSLDVSSLASGAYWIEITEDKHMQRIKFVKK